MEFLAGVFALLLGAALGSFANVLVIRMHEASTIWGRSHCVHCERVLRPHHLVPILSWLMLRGRCAFCRKTIHWQYPVVESAAALLALIAFLRHPFLLDATSWSWFLFEMLFAIDLLVLVTFDLRWKLLPIEFMVGSAIIFSAWHAWLTRPSILMVAVGLAVGAGFLGIQVLLSHGRWMGSGDPWLGGLIGAVLGWPGIAISLYLTYIGGGMAALILLVSGAVKRGARIPFGPFLAGGAMLTLWFGPLIESWFRARLF